jgi:hypothetical protein
MNGGLTTPRFSEFWYSIVVGHGVFFCKMANTCVTDAVARDSKTGEWGLGGRSAEEGGMAPDYSARLINTADRTFHLKTLIAIPLVRSFSSPDILDHLGWKGYLLVNPRWCLDSW